MNASMKLFDRALTNRTYQQLAAEVGVTTAAIGNSKRVGHLSPLLAGQIAVLLNEDPLKWIAVAAVECAKPGRAKRELMKAMEPHVKSCF